MSDVFELDTAGQRSLAGEASANLLQPDQNTSGFFHGVPQAIGLGVMRGGARAAQAVGMAGGGLLSQLEQDGEGAPGLKPGTLTDPYFHALDEFVSSAIDYWTPGANEVGTAGRILGGFSEMALPLMAGGGNPSLLIGSAAMGTGHDLVQQGVDAKTATGVAVTQAAATAIGFRIPFLGSTLVSRIASGAAGNVAVNAGSAEISHAILQAAGYDEQAKNFDPLDLEARIVDLLSGAVFGTVAHLGSPSLRDAAATAANAKHFQFETAPGDPADIGSSIAHQKAMEAAIRDTLEGNPVDLSGTGVDKANFIPRERTVGPLAEVPEELQGVDEALKPETTHVDQIAAAELPESTRVPLAQHYERAAEAKPVFDATVREISQETGTPHEPKLPGLKGVARASEKAMAEYGGDASQLKDLVRGTIVADNPQQIQAALDGMHQHFGELIGLRNHLTSDSPPVSKDGYRDIKANVVVNGHMAEVQVNVPEMLAAKKKAHPLYDQDRSISAKAELEDRDVTPAENRRQIELRAKQAKIYAAAWDAFLTRSRNTDSDTKVPLWAKDEEGNRRPDVTSQARQTPSGVSEQGTPSTSAKSVPGGNEGSDMSSTSTRSIPETGPNSSDPVIRSAFQALTERDFKIPTGETDAGGNPVYRSAREVMAQSEADVAQAKKDAKGFDALVGCILTKGDG